MRTACRVHTVIVLQDDLWRALEGERVKHQKQLKETTKEAVRIAQELAESEHKVISVTTSCKKAR